MDLTSYLAALERRHLANLTQSEVTRALRALSSCYVERRAKLAGGGALEGAGKRAAFALFYGPLHFMTIGEVVRALGAHERRIGRIHDLGCGTGVGGSAWALACATPPDIAGIDRNRWAVAEANWMYREFAIRGTAKVGDAVLRFPDFQISKFPNAAVLLGYAVNELEEAARASLLNKVEQAIARGASLLVVESIAKRDKEWWPEWVARLTAAGARADEWRFHVTLPPLIRQLAKGAGLDPRELTARTIYKA